LDTRHRKKTRIPPKTIDTGNIGYKTQKEDTDLTKKGRHGKHWTQEDTDPTKKIDTENIGHKTQKDRHRYH
jgi:hypothetical protein